MAGRVDKVIKTVGLNIKKYRKMQKMSQTDLADLLNVTQTTVSQWEVGRNAPSVDTLVKICSIIKVPAMQCLFDDSLTCEEIELIEQYKRLSDDGKGKLRERINELLRLEKMDKGCKAVR